MDEVKLKIEPPVAWVVLNRTEARNALSTALLENFERALDQITRRRDVAGVVITGEGQVFCAGADLKQMREMIDRSRSAVREDSDRLMQFLQRIFEFPVPTVAAVNGAALGGGCGLVSVCDIVIASKQAVFGYPESKIGIAPALVAVFLLRICGEKKARELLLTGKTLSAQEARDIGLVNAVVQDDSLLEKSREMVESLAENSPMALALTKELVHNLYGMSLEEALRTAREVNAFSRSTQDFREGVASFFEKRRPEWKRK